MNTYSILPLISALLFLLLGYLCFRKKGGQSYVKYFCLLCLVTFGWQFSWFVLFNVNNKFLADILVRIGYSAIIFIPVFYYHFVIAFLNREKIYWFDLFFLKISYALAIIFEILLWTTDLYIAGYYKYFWGFYPKASYIHLVYLAILSAQALRSIYLLYIFPIRKEFSGRVKTQTKLLFFAFLIYFFAAIDFLVNYSFEFYPPGVIFILLAFGITFYAITKHHLMDIDVIIRKGTVYSIVVGLFTGVYLIAVFLISQIFQNFTRANSLFVVIPVLLVFAVLFQPVKNRVQGTIDKLFFKQKYDYQKTIRELSEATTSVVDLEALLRLVSRTVVERMKVEGASVFVVEKRDAYRLKGCCKN